MAMGLPRFLRRKRLNWKLLVLLTVALLGAYYFLDTRLLFKPREDEVLRFRQKRFDKYQQTEKSRKGLGEFGEPVILTGEEKKLADSLFKKEAFNIIASDKISLERSVKDVRDER